MIFDEPFIWYKDHYVYHITNKSNMKSIREKGLIPSLGDRSLKVGDNIKAIFFFDNIYNLDEWCDALYKDCNKDELEVLRFNLKRRKWYIHDGEDFYIKSKVDATKLEFLKAYDKNNNQISLGNIYKDDCKYKWEKIKKYGEVV